MKHLRATSEQLAQIAKGKDLIVVTRHGDVDEINRTLSLFFKEGFCVNTSANARFMFGKSKLWLSDWMQNNNATARYIYAD